MRSLLLASTSPYRRVLMSRLGLPFETVNPKVDETAHVGESARALVTRLSRQKAIAVAKEARGSIVIGSDQAAVLDGRILGKPGDAQSNLRQLQRCSGRTVRFLTGVCVLDTDTMRANSNVVPFDVRFRHLREDELRRYVHAENPVDCAGGFKAEGLGVTLFEWMHGEDPTALVGLPLIRLCALLRIHGIDPLN